MSAFSFERIKRGTRMGPSRARATDATAFILRGYPLSGSPGVDPGTPRSGNQAIYDWYHDLGDRSYPSAILCDIHSQGLTNFEDYLPFSIDVWVTIGRGQHFAVWWHIGSDTGGNPSGLPNSEVDLVEMVVDKDFLGSGLLISQGTIGDDNDGSIETNVAAQTWRTHSIEQDGSDLVWKIDGVEKHRQAAAPWLTLPVAMVISWEIGGNWPGLPVSDDPAGQPSDPTAGTPWPCEARLRNMVIAGMPRSFSGQFGQVYDQQVPGLPFWEGQALSQYWSAVYPFGYKNSPTYSYGDRRLFGNDGKEAAASNLWLGNTFEASPGTTTLVDALAADGWPDPFITRATILPVDPPAPPDEGGYAETIPLRLAPGALEGVVDNAMVLPLALTDNRLRTSGNGGESLDDGLDIRIETSGGVVVPYQRDSYDGTAGTLTGWIRLPSGVDETGFAMNLKIGDADGVDQSADPAIVWDGYLISAKSDGTDRVAGNDFTLGTGVATNAERRDGITLPGNATAATADASWRAGTAICRHMLIKGVAGQLGTDKGWTDQGPIGLGPNRGAVARNRLSGIGSSGASRTIFLGEQFSGGFAYIQGPGQSEIGADWVHVIANFVAGQAPTLYRNGRQVVASAALTPSGSIAVQPGPLQLGRGPFDLESDGWEGAIAAFQERTYAYGANEAALLCRMLNFDWNPLQLADSEGDFAALPTVPDIDPEAPPPDPGEDGGTPLPTPLRTVNVSNQTQFNAAYADATPGDAIVLANGNYTIPNSNSWAKSGTSANPIVVRAANVLGAVITGNYSIACSHVIFYGLDHPDREVRLGEFVQTDGLRIWRCRWRDKPAPSDRIGLRTWKATGLDIAYCSWTNWGGRALALGPAAGTTNTTLRRLYLGPTPVSGSYTNAHEGLQIGFGDGDRLVDSQISVLECLLEGWDSDDEAVSVKTSGVLLRNVNAINCRGRLNNRMGTGNRWEACVATGSNGNSGIRIHDRDNEVLGCDGSGAAGGIRIGTGNTDAALNSTSNLTPNALRTYVGGCVGTLQVGHSFSSGSWPEEARFTTVRDHTGAVSLISGGQENTDSQPAQPATGQSWVSTISLTSSNTGPLAP